METESLSISLLVIVEVVSIEYNKICREIRDWIGEGDSRSSDNAVFSVSCTCCLWYLVYVALGECSTCCIQYFV